MEEPRFESDKVEKQEKLVLTAEEIEKKKKALKVFKMIYLGVPFYLFAIFIVFYSGVVGEMDSSTLKLLGGTFLLLSIVEVVVAIFLTKHIKKQISEAEQNDR